MSPDCGSKEDAGCGGVGSLGGKLGASGDGLAEGAAWLGVVDGLAVSDVAGVAGVGVAAGAGTSFFLPFIFMKTRAPIKTTTTIPPTIFNIQILFLIY